MGETFVLSAPNVATIGLWYTKSCMSTFHVCARGCALEAKRRHPGTMPPQTCTTAVNEQGACVVFLIFAYESISLYKFHMLLRLEWCINTPFQMPFF